MWVLVQVFSMEVVTEIVNLTFTKNCVKLWKKTLLYMKKTAKPLPPETAGKKYSGKFLLRPGKELHKTLAIRALQTDQSLNNFCLNVLKSALFHSNRSNGLNSR